VSGYEGLYEVSDQGRVRSLDRLRKHSRSGHSLHPGRVLKPGASQYGHLRVTLVDRDSQKKRWLVHRLVAAAFVGPCPEGMEVCHNDGIPAHNHVGNLRYDTHSANLLDAVGHGTHPMAGAFTCGRGHEYTPENTIRRSGQTHHRECRTCRNDRKRENDLARRRQAVVVPPKLGGTCPGGHEYTEANTYMCKVGYRMCRACNRDRQQKRREAKQGVRLNA